MRCKRTFQRIAYDDALTEPPVPPKPPERTPLEEVLTPEPLGRYPEVVDEAPPELPTKSMPPVRTWLRLLFPPAQLGSGVPSGRSGHGRLAACGSPPQPKSAIADPRNRSWTDRDDRMELSLSARKPRGIAR